MRPDIQLGSRTFAVNKTSNIEPWGWVSHVKDFWGLRTNVVKRNRFAQLRLIQRCLAINNQSLLDSFTKALNEIGKSVSVTFEPIVREYVKAVEKIPIVHEILVTESEDECIIWTKIEATPFEDSLRDPIYDAQLEILRSLPEDTQIDFRIINVSEISKDESTNDILPQNAYLFWER